MYFIIKIKDKVTGAKLGYYTNEHIGNLCATNSKSIAYMFSNNSITEAINYLKNTYPEFNFKPKKLCIN